MPRRNYIPMASRKPGKGNKMKPQVLKNTVLTAFKGGLRPIELEKLGFKHGTGVRLCKKIKQLGLKKEDVEAMPAKRLFEMFYPKAKARSDSLDENGNPIHIQPDIPALYQELKNQQASGSTRTGKKLMLTRSLIFREFYYNDPENISLAEQGRQFLKEPTLYALLRTYERDHTGRTCRKNHEFGQELQIDFTGVQLPYGDKENPQKATFLVCVLPAGGYIYVQAISGQKSRDVMNGLIDCFKHLGGVPDVLRVDNFKAAISEAGLYGGETTADMDALARVFNFEVYNCRVKTPKDKGCVEACVRAVTRYPLALANHYIQNGKWFDTLTELNKFLAPHVGALNDRVVRGMIQSRKERFELEKKFLHQPISWDLSAVTCLSFKVPPTLTFTYNEHDYALSEEWKNAQLDVEIDKDTVRFLCGSTVIESYPRQDWIRGMSAKPGYLEKKDEIMQIYSVRSQEPMLIEWAESIGPAVARWTASSLRSKTAYNDKIRRIVKVLSLPCSFIVRGRQLDDCVADLMRRKSFCKVGAHQIIKEYQKLELSNDNRADAVHNLDNYFEAGKEAIYGRCTVMHWTAAEECQTQGALERPEQECLNGTAHYQEQYAAIAEALGQFQPPILPLKADGKSNDKEEL